MSDSALLRVLLAADAQASSQQAQLVALRSTLQAAIAMLTPAPAPDPRTNAAFDTFDGVDEETPAEPRNQPTTRASSRGRRS